MIQKDLALIYSVYPDKDYTGKQEVTLLNHLSSSVSYVMYIQVSCLQKLTFPITRNTDSKLFLLCALQLLTK